MRGPGLVIVGACALFVAPARGSVEDWGSAAVPSMRPYRDDASGRERPRRLELDGMTLAVAAGRTADAPGEVASYYAAALGDARHGCGARFGDEERGGVAAIDYGEALDGDTLAARMGRLAATGELSTLGQLQAVWYERRADGGTRYLNLWGTLSIDKLLPAAGGDVAGSELDGVPRPSGGARVLSAGEHGAAGRVVAYRVAGASAVAVRSDFVDELHARGWQSDQAFLRYAAAHARSGERLVRRGREIFVDVGRDGDDVTVVVIEMERRG